MRLVFVPLPLTLPEDPEPDLPHRRVVRDDAPDDDDDDEQEKADCAERHCASGVREDHAATRTNTTDASPLSRDLRQTSPPFDWSPPASGDVFPSMAFHADAEPDSKIPT